MSNPAALIKLRGIPKKQKEALQSGNALPCMSPVADIEGRRFYLTGLPAKIKPEIISTHLAKYGEVAYVELDGLIDEEQAAFVTFKESTDKVKELSVKSKELEIDGQHVSVVKATPKKTQVFVGGLKPEVTAETLAHYFSAFGTVHDTMVKYDPATGISRCFGFVTYTDCDDIVHMLCKQRFFCMHGKRIEVKKAVPMSEQINMKKAQMKAAFLNEWKRGNFLPPIAKPRMPRPPSAYGTALYEAAQHGSIPPVSHGRRPRYAPSFPGMYHNSYPPRYY